MKHRTILTAAFLAVVACGQAAPTGTGSAPSGVARSESAPAPAANEAAAELEEEIPTEPFTDGARAFSKVKETLLQNYYAEGLTEDDVYRAATAGMLEKIDPNMKKWNRLMGAKEMAELRNDLKGEVVGIGAHIRLDHTGYAEVLATFPGSPAEKAGLVMGDLIVSVDGKVFKGMRLRDIVASIRGKAGEQITLSVLRGAKLESISVVRDRVAYDQASQTMLPDHLGYVRIPGFNDKTPGAVRAALEDLKKNGATSLVLDLRQNPGGSFDRAIETAELFLPERTGVVTLKRRGKPEEKHLSRGGGILLDVPLAVLVDATTGSGAEFVTGALQEGRHARVVGATTKGKWSVQMLDELSNGYAFKYTVSLFKTPAGKSYEGTGLVPEIEVKLDDRQLARANVAKTPEERLDLDVQLRTAKEILIKK
jgi:carboxyl-terminal processing protease